MARILLFCLVMGSAFALGGCLAGMAAGAVGVAARSAQGEPASNAHLQPTARQACSDHATQYGAVHIIDVQQRAPNKITVWGTVDNGKDRRSFECGYGTKITGFKLRAIVQRQ
jgi:hypothetical protein